MVNHHPHLFRPLKVGSLTIKNRIESAPMSLTELSAKEGYTDENKAFFGEIAKGGAGIVVVGESVVNNSGGKTHFQQIVLNNPAILPSLTEMADTIHQYNAVASIEISHGGELAPPDINSGAPIIGPVTRTSPEGHLIVKMDEKMMNEIADAFAAASQTVKNAGFDMCMIHSGHGWLLSQFLSPLTNTRDDLFGGPSIENRARFPLMVIDRVRDRVGQDFPIELRISGSEFKSDALDIDDAIHFAQMVQDKVDLIHVSAADPWSESMRMCMPVFLPRGSNVYLAEAVKKEVNIPVVAIGALVDPSQMDDIIANNQADMVAIGRGLVADPHLPRKAKEGRDGDIVPCIRCYMCNETGYSDRALKCSINPRIGRQTKTTATRPPARVKKVLVAGGGPGGIQAAITASKRGHNVILCEKSDTLGGALRFAEHIPFKEDLNTYTQYLIRQINKQRVTIQLNTEVTPNLIADIAPEVLIAAIGSEPIIPTIPGIDSPKTVFASGMFADDVILGMKVVVIGGGLVGCEAGIHLANLGKDVTVVEMLDDVFKDATRDHGRAMRTQLDNITVRLNTRCVEINDLGVITINPQGTKDQIEADTVVVAVGLKSLSDEVDALRETAFDFIAIGDCLKPKKVLEAVRSGYDAGMSI